MGGAVGGLVYWSPRCGLRITRAGRFSYLVAFAYWAGIALGVGDPADDLPRLRGQVDRRCCAARSRPWRPPCCCSWCCSFRSRSGCKHLYSGSIRPATLPRDGAQAAGAQEAVPEPAASSCPHGRLLRCVASSSRAAVPPVDPAGRDAGPSCTRSQRTLRRRLLPLIALAFTFAAFDWLMSLDPLWFSTIFGVYFFAGSFWQRCRCWPSSPTGRAGADLFGDLMTSSTSTTSAS